ncbi:short-subunit dehydrogenase [Mumia flava]|uniref:Short-subunit dehydrogenase n=1 Tax=Mumia flava TaxID=1348852 RepID=A0A0B2BGV3_9ACTN|nr:SDR family NAD(P)-dependent oxidoreductase [Mumia flava]PJJ56363.1 short-subunit dehydrogenase [Mumia flava]
MSAAGRVVVVTGGTRGIGLGLARELLARGCRVVVCGRSPERLADAVTELGAAGDPFAVTGLVADITDRTALSALWDHAVATFGRVDVWINNAGMSAPRRPLAEVPSEAVETVVATNLVGTVHGCAVASAGLAAQSGGGWIWNMEGFGSDGQIQPGMAVYGASKRGVSYLTAALVKETKGTSVKVGSLSPGIVATDLLVDDYDGQPEAFEKARRIFNILGDRVETVTPWLAERLLAEPKHGAKVAWLTRSKAFGRFMTAGFRSRDIFAPSGDRAAA